MKRISLRKTPMKTIKNDVIELNPELTNGDNGDARDVQGSQDTTACKVKSIVKKKTEKFLFFPIHFSRISKFDG